MDELAPGDVSAFLRDQLDPWFVWATTTDDGPCKATGSPTMEHMILPPGTYTNTYTWSGNVDASGNACGFGIGFSNDDLWADYDNVSSAYNNVWHGKTHYQNVILSETCEVRNNLRHGKCTAHWADGELVRNYLYDNGDNIQNKSLANPEEEAFFNEDGSVNSALNTNWEDYLCPHVRYTC